MGLISFFRRNRHERAGSALYGAAVAAARDPFFYTELAVPDTLDGRFDLVGLHAFLIIRRLTQAEADVQPQGPALAQAVFDAMFSDMEINLREMGVGDLSVPRKVRAMWEAFHGRAAAYGQALDQDDIQALEAALARNIWRGEPVPAGALTQIARLVQAQSACLAGQTVSVLASGAVSFLPARDAAR